MDGRHRRALGALAAMAYQYLREYPDGLVDSDAMSAGEHAILSLVEYGYMTDMDSPPVRARWTDAGNALLAWDYPYDQQGDKEFPEPPIRG